MRVRVKVVLDVVVVDVVDRRRCTLRRLPVKRGRGIWGHVMLKLFEQAIIMP